MKKSDIKVFVGMAGNVVISSDGFRYSELLSFVEKVNAMESGSITIKVIDGTLTLQELVSLSRVGGKFLTLDLSEV